MTTPIDHRNKKILKGRVIIALCQVLGRKPTNEEIEHYYRVARALYLTSTPAFLERQQLNRTQRQT